MPNWVYNKMTITGSKEDLDSIESLFAKTIQSTTYNHETKQDEYIMEDVVFTYSALISHKDLGISDEEYHSVNGYSGGVQTGNTPGNWYNWNQMYWGVKWDACNATKEREDDNTLVYRFDSPWAPPSKSLWQSLSYLYEGRIQIDYSYEEEQGWGGEWTMKNNEFISSEEWDIPMSHADHMKLSRTCNCEIYFDDVEYMFDDCPAKMEAMSNA